MVSSRDASEHASKKVQEKGTAALLNATAPFSIPIPAARDRACWRLAPRKPLFHRLATPTMRLEKRRAAIHVGALHPASPCSFVGPRQPRRLFPGTRPFMLAPCTPQALVPSSGCANPGAFFPARGLPCWRRAPRKPLSLRRAAPTPVPRSDSVRARLSAKPMNSVYEREPWNGKRRKSSPRSGSVRARQPAKPMNSVYEREPPAMLAPCTPQALVSPLGHANLGAFPGPAAELCEAKNTGIPIHFLERVIGL